MKCNKCGTDNSANSKFCCECGSKLEKLCPKCQTPVAGNIKFCPECGTNLMGESPVSAVMKDNVIAGDVNQSVHYVTNVYNPAGADKTVDLECCICHTFIPHSREQQSRCTGCGRLFCDKHMEDRVCRDCQEEQQLAPYLYEELAGGKYLIKGVKGRISSYVTIPNKVEIIDAQAFMNKDVIEVILPEGLVRIGARAFANCKYLEKIHFPESLKHIEEEAFQNCKSLDVAPPQNVRVHATAFNGTDCHKKQEEQRRKAEAVRKAEEARTAEEARKIENAACVAEKKCKEEEARKLAAARWLESFRQIGETQKVTETQKVEEKRKAKEPQQVQGKWKAEEKNITEASRIEAERFAAECARKKAEVERKRPESLALNRRAFTTADFEFQTLAVNSELPERQLLHVINIRNDSVIFPSCDNQGYPVQHIADYAVTGCLNIQSATIPEGIQTIGRLAFSECRNLLRIDIPDSLLRIDELAFYHCTKLVGLSLPAGVCSLGDGAFQQCTALRSVSFRDPASPSSQNAHMSTPHSLMEIPNDAFNGCSNLNIITIPPYVTHIGKSAFEGCTSLTDIKFCGTKAAWKAISFGENWNKKVPASIITCSDGKIYLDYL